MDLMEPLVLVAFAGFFFVELVRALPWPKKWKERKPLSCLTCMAGWTAIGGWAWLGELTPWSVAFWFAAAGGMRMLLAMRETLAPEMPDVEFPKFTDAGDTTQHTNLNQLPDLPPVLNEDPLVKCESCQREVLKSELWVEVSCKHCHIPY